MSYIDPRGKVLRHLDRIAGWRAGVKPAPVSVEWDLSNRCSLGCQDCHFAHTHSKGPWAGKAKRLPMAFESTGDQADLALVERVMGELATAGVKGIIWSGGGEPTLHPKWRDAVGLASFHGLSQGMYTLGGHLSSGDAAYLGTRAAFVVVSLDAVDADTYAREKGVPPGRFADACDGIRRLSGYRAAVGVSFLLHVDNYPQIGAMVALARSLGATYTTLRPAVQFDADAPAKPNRGRDWITLALPALEHYAQARDVEVDVERFRQYRDWQGHGYDACQGPTLNTTITPDGRVWACPNKRGVPGALLGDLRRESFASVWARHPGRFAVDRDCRVMCRLHPVNQTLHELSQPKPHEVFV